MRKKALALALCLGMAALLSGCRPSPTAVVIDGNNIDASEYAFYLNYARLNLENEYGYLSDGIYDDEITAKAKESALDQLVTNEVVRLQCRELGLELSREEEQTFADNKKEFVDSLGGKAKYLDFLRQSAMTDRSYDKFQKSSMYYDKLYDYVTTGQGGALYSDQELRQYFSGNYATVKYICFSLIDAGGQTISGAAAEAILEQANSALASARQEDADFDGLIETYNQDPLMSGNPEGLVVSLGEAQGVPYLEAAFQLEENQVGGVYQDEDGYYIVKRMPVSAGYFEENKDTILQTATDAKFSELLEQWKGEAKVTTTSVYQKINLENLDDFVK